MDERNYAYAGLAGEDDFFRFLGRIRGEKKVGLAELCEGICSASMLARIEKGERETGLLLQDRLLSRMGIADDGYECYLMPGEYRKWEERNRIMTALEEGKLKEARELTGRYERAWRKEDVIEEQFCLTMGAWILKLENASENTLGERFAKALRRTVPDIDSRELKGMCLSLQELNLILEYTRYCSPERLTDRCREILQYLEESGVDRLNRAKIEPKVLYYLCRSLPSETVKDMEKRVELCRQGIELLRDEGKMYYLCELLELQEEQCRKLAFMLEECGESRKRRLLEAEREEVSEWRRILEKLYDTYGVSSRMSHDGHLYQKRNVYNVSEVIRIRREMLHMTKKELCEGICSEKAIGRLELGKTGRPQKAIVYELFDRLRLPRGYKREELITDNRQVLDVVHEFCRVSNEREYPLARQCLKQLKGMGIKKHVVNQQWVEDKELLLAFRMGEIDNEIYASQMKRTLELTLPITIALERGDKFYTAQEISCIYHIADALGEDQLNPYYDVLQQMLQQMEKDGRVHTMISTYEWLMDALSSLLGNMGNFNMSDDISKKLIRVSLENRRLHQLNSILYNLAWNEKEKRKRGIPANPEVDLKEKLRECLSLSRFYKQQFSIIFLEKTLKSEEWSFN